MRLRHLALILTAALTAAPAISRADGADGSPAQMTVPTAERQKLRTALDQVNSEIDALKRETRGLGDDYRLRAKMADAEALARRLTELDARAGNANRSPAGRTNLPWPIAPQASPSDDRSDLEAKADILSDQSRRLSNQADVLTRRVDDLRGRQELRRRAGQLERDPFSPLEQAKRRIATAAPTSALSKEGTASSPTVGTKDVAPPPGGGQSAPGPGGPTTVVAGGAVPGVGAASPTPTTPTQATSTRVADSSITQGQTLVSSTAAGDSGSSVATQFRGILDAATLAEIRRLETPGSPSGNLQAMERALILLRARAIELEASAVALRKRARTTP